LRFKSLCQANPAKFSKEYIDSISKTNDVNDDDEEPSEITWWRRLWVL